MFDEIQMALMLFPHYSLEKIISVIGAVFNTQNTPTPRRLKIMEDIKISRPDVYEAYMKDKPSCSGDQHQGRSFITPNKKMKQVPRRTYSPPVIPVQNSFFVFQETEKPMETTDPLPIQEESTYAEITNNKTLRPPPLVIRDKKQWPRINETLKSHGIKSYKNFNTRDGVRMILPTMEMFNKSKDILDKQKTQYHTFNTPTNREIRAIFKGVAEDIEPDLIAKELQDKGFDPRIVARFRNKKGQSMPIILVIVPGHCAGHHESRAHDKDAEGPNKCSNCGAPHKSNYRGCPDFPREEKDEKKDPPPPPKRVRTPRGDNNNTGTLESSALNDLLTAMDELKDLIIRRPILAGLIQLKNSQGATFSSSD
ncbi:hypothetical protein JTB14_001488 [Gonioctena quinquepunctata]|nr:hypothetical protein JTB14_001488 [Gonioctena quinquepunctata]